jgi:hypothetical protein
MENVGKFEGSNGIGSPDFNKKNQPRPNWTNSVWTNFLFGLGQFFHKLKNPIRLDFLA